MDETLAAWTVDCSAEQTAYSWVARKASLSAVLMASTWVYCWAALRGERKADWSEQSRAELTAVTSAAQRAV